MKELHIKASRDYERKHGRKASWSVGYNNQKWFNIRQRILIRDRYMCQADGCGAMVGMAFKDAHIDHIIPKSEGGLDVDSNLQTLCVSCHSTKTYKENNVWGGNK